MHPWDFYSRGHTVYRIPIESVQTIRHKIEQGFRQIRISKSVCYGDNQIEHKTQNYLQMVNPWLRYRPLITRQPV